jgi:hypothetical protein
MAELLRVTPLMECMSDPATVDWLTGAGVPLPDEIPPGRYPAPAEIRAVVEAIPGTRTFFRASASVWQAAITSRRDVAWASLVVRDYSGDENQPHPFYFDGGWDEVIVLVVSHLARICGPFVLMADSGAPPRLVM